MEKKTECVKSKIIETYKEKVDLTSETDTFADLVSLALKCVIGGALERLEPSLRSMASRSWGGDAQVGEESVYILHMGQALRDFVPRVREHLSATYFNTFCTRLSTEVLLR